METKHQIYQIAMVVLFFLFISGYSNELYNSTNVEQTGINLTPSTPHVEKYVYKQTPQGELAIYVHFPKDWTVNDKRPAIVFFFGGAWDRGTVEQFLPQAEYLAGRGMVTARADYRVRNRHGTMPDKCVEDGKSVVRWLRVNAAKLGIDPNRIAASGHSAGGHIATCTYTTEALDSQGEDLSVSSKPNLLVLFAPAGLSGVPSVGVGPEMRIKISPYNNLSKEVPPAFLFFGTNDAGLVAGIDFIEKSKKLGNIAELYTAEGQGHWSFQESPWLERTIYLADKFLAKYGYTRGEPTIELPEGKVEINNMSGVDLNAYVEERLGHTPLHRAVRNGDKELVELLIANGADVNAKDFRGHTPLIGASRDIMEMLIAKGADVNVKNKGGYTPLHLIARVGNKELVELLIANRADIDIKNNSGSTPLHLAASKGNKDVVEFLISKGADVNVKDNRRNTPLGLAEENGRTEVVELLREHGSTKSLHEAAASGDIEQVKSLVSQGADVDTRNNRGRTPLHDAAANGEKDVAELLIENDADVNAKNDNGQTPLHLAARRGKKSIVELLIAKGADVNAKNNAGQTPLNLAKQRGHTEIIELLRKHGAKE